MNIQALQNFSGDLSNFCEEWVKVHERMGFGDWSPIIATVGALCLGYQVSKCGHSAGKSISKAHEVYKNNREKLARQPAEEEVEEVHPLIWTVSQNELAAKILDYLPHGDFFNFASVSQSIKNALFLDENKKIVLNKYKEIKKDLEPFLFRKDLARYYLAMGITEKFEKVEKMLESFRILINWNVIANEFKVLSPVNTSAIQNVDELYQKADGLRNVVSNINIDNAVKENKINLVKQYLVNGGKVTEAMLYQSFKKDYLEMAKLLIRYDSYSDDKVFSNLCQDMEFGRLVLRVFSANSPKFAKLLLENGVKATDSMLIEAIENTHYEMVKLLIEHGANVSEEMVKVLFETANLDMIKILIENEKVDRSDALKMAVEKGWIPIVESLLDGLEVFSNELIYLAQDNNQKEIAKLLIKKKAELYQPSS